MIVLTCGLLASAVRMSSGTSRWRTVDRPKSGENRLFDFASVVEDSWQGFARPRIECIVYFSLQRTRGHMRTIWRDITARTQRFLIILQAVLATCALPAVGHAEAINFEGDYYFYSNEQASGPPVCSERWQFNSDGTETIYSGQEIVTQQFRAEPKSQAVSWLFVRYLKTNGLPDCTGHQTAKLSPDERLIIVYVTASGKLVVCAPIYDTSGKLFAMRGVGSLYRTPQTDPSDTR